jgi:hypothetical protein
MTERGILFAAPMVRALLAGTKTQTRRAVKITHRTPGLAACLLPPVGAPRPKVAAELCPYGQPGDRLWVLETWGVVSNAWDDDGNLVDWVPDRPATAVADMPFGQGYYSGHAIYAADGSYEWAGDDDGGGEPRSAWHPSIHMPRWASRILLEITSVRVERLNECSNEDARAEGVMPLYANQCVMAGHVYNAIPLFRNLWERINGPGSWEANPFVWVVEFKRVQP